MSMNLPPWVPQDQIARVTDLSPNPAALPDDAARTRIAEDLEANLLVEAGAGSGKTTALVNRMVRLLATGTAQVGEIAAVTFTRKAAAELKERFQAELEGRVRSDRGGEGERDDDDPDLVTERLGLALRDIDQAFVGTIHSFCGRLLRERPLDIGLDPGFEELAADEAVRLRRAFWEGYLERLVREEDPALEGLARTGLRASALYGTFERLLEHPDVAFDAEHVAPPSEQDIQRIRGRLDALVDRAWELMPDRVPNPDWDDLQKKFRRLRFTREITGWREHAHFFEALAELHKDRGEHKVTQKRWKDGALAKAFADEVNRFAVGDTEAGRLLHRWYEHRYALAVRLARQAAEAFQAYRRRTARLDFQDLLLLSAELLRSRPDARRELGLRYRRLLVDEFQDTDPLQAEIMLLLASDPEEATGEPGADADWRRARPRPGALFVVGDPKQSIYRFRRADIQLYQFVKERFRDFGAAIELTTNFRSRPPIGRLVNEHLSGDGFFPAAATAEQAAFEPLRTLPAEDDGRAGVYVYDVEPKTRRRSAVAEDEAARLATWIHGRVRSGDRTPGSFLILTVQKRSIEAYARALESWGLPVQVTGAGVGVEEELRELRVLIDCMIDPTNTVKVVSALVGLFFGLDYERLLQHRLAGGTFNAMHPGVDGEPDVLHALEVLHGWWRRSATEAADIFLGQVVSEVGLLPFAAAGELGSLRAGALVYALDVVRSAVLAGHASLPGARDALDAALELGEAEAPLEPGRDDAVRVMNLHQAKGLEAEVVVLADPAGATTKRAPNLHVRRSEEGTAVGYLRITERGTGAWVAETLAQAPGWADWESAEQAFEDAERTRLLYVAVTRAREELWIGRRPGRGADSPWGPLDGWLDAHAGQEALEEAEAPPPGTLAPEVAAEVDRTLRASQERVCRAAERGHAFVSVTRVAKEGAGGPVDAGVGRPTGSPPRSPARSTEFRGFSWGTVVHEALAAAGDLTDPEALRAACRALLVEHGRPVDDHGDPTEWGELLELVEAVRRSEIWRRAGAATRTFTEIPLALRDDGAHLARPTAQTDTRRRASASGLRQLDLFGAGATGPTEDPAPVPDEPVATEAPGATEARTAAGTQTVERDGEGRVPRVLEGVIDLVFEEPDGWVVVDYKTDVGSDPLFPNRVRGYRRQVDLYAEAWARLTGAPVKERVLFFTAQDRVERW